MNYKINNYITRTSTIATTELQNIKQENYNNGKKSKQLNEKFTTNISYQNYHQASMFLVSSSEFAAVIES